MLSPQTKTHHLARQIKFDHDLWLKREDLHPYGSHKGRSIPLMIEKYAADGWQNFCISSSGNAALAAIMAVNKKPKIGLTVFVGEKINKEKLKAIKNAAKQNKLIKIKQTSNPKQSAFLMDKNNKAKNLRQSTDDAALIGYEELAKELSQIKNLAAIFIPTSSGTTAQGLYNGFKKLNINPQIHIVQTTACHPMTDTNINTKKSIADAVVDKIAHRKEQVLETIKKSNGRAWAADDKIILEAIKLVKDNEDIDISPNSALSVAGLMMTVKEKWPIDGVAVCLITGR